jgi:acyltransferase
VGAALVAATCWTGVGTLPPANPLLIAFRIGVILLVVAALTHVPAGAAGRVAPLGRASLAIYAIHVPLVYGWSTLDGLAQRVGPTRGAGAALGIAACVLVASVGIHRVVGAARWLVATGAARVRAAAAGAGATDLE